LIATILIFFQELIQKGEPVGEDSPDPLGSIPGGVEDNEGG
jgi:hypothetical protein